MGKIDDLIQKHCPCGVEYKTLGELGKFYGGVTGKSKEDFKGGNAKFISYMNVYTNPELDLSTNDKIRISLGERQNTLEYGDVVFTGSSETADECGISSVLTVKPNVPLYLNSFCFFFRFNDPEIMLPGFSKHLFRSYELRKQIRKAARGVTRFNISKTLMQCVEIPVPPLEVQREIVHILDTLTLLIAALTAELTARKKQYAFYRDGLLTSRHNSYSKKKLGDIATILRGASPRPINAFLTDDESGVNWIKIGDVKEGSKYITQTAEKITQEGAEYSRRVNKGDFILSNSMSFGRPYILKIDGCIHDGWLSISGFEDEIRSSYLYHLLMSSDIQYEMKRRASFGGAVQNLNADIVKNLVISIPPFEVQDKIVKVLENFETICSDLKIGLPAEIEAREKQYSYYREKLLSFTRIEQDTSSILDKLEILNNDMIESSHAEIEARQKQYEYYRDNLIIFDPKK